MQGMQYTVEHLNIFIEYSTEYSYCTCAVEVSAAPANVCSVLMFVKE